MKTEVEMETDKWRGDEDRDGDGGRDGVYSKICVYRHVVHHGSLDGLIGFIRPMSQKED